jgi:hypothetical protein
MKWLGVWLLLTVVYVGALLLCRQITGQLTFSRADLLDLLFIPAVQVAALAAVAAAARDRRRR